MNLYIVSHVHYIEGLEADKSQELFDKLYNHTRQENYIIQVDWHGSEDLLIWDNT